MTLLTHRRSEPARTSGTAETLKERAHIEHAKGLVAASGELSRDDAFQRIRRHSIATGTPLAEVARALLQRVLRL